MLSPQYKQKVGKLWDMFWSAGMTNPLTSIEQITYLLFLKQLEQLDKRRVRDDKPSIYAVRLDCKLPHPRIDPNDPLQCTGHEFCKWSKIRSEPDAQLHQLISQYVFAWLRELDATLILAGNEEDLSLASETRGILADAYFQLPPEKTNTLQQALDIVDDLFPDMDIHRANADLMGEIFEYLLSEIKSSGKNGQFRTPRHIIRFMVELLDPKPEEHIIDPAAGTGGFLFSSIQHLLKQVTPVDKLRLEWDGTPHNLVEGDKRVKPYLKGHYFTGYDNDRTMVRIGWMNMILHGIENPHIELRDSLGKSLPDGTDNPKLGKSGKYQVVLANPPFTGNVDTGDLHPRRFRFTGKGKSRKALTDKSELLFLWLILDLLANGGRAAVIVPDGVLFGSTTAHRTLRRELLFEHDLQAVISLPAGVFQPYSGVKTSILVFSKVGGKVVPGAEPNTRNVWFYEVVADGLTLDARRNPDYTRNDLWDALEKYPKCTEQPKRQDYFQPRFFDERWRVVDERLLNPKLYPDLVAMKGKTLGLHELFTDLPADPAQATQIIIDTQRLKIAEAFEQYLTACLSTISATIVQAAQTSTDPTTSGSAAREKASECLTEFTRLFNSARRDRDLLESEFDQFGRAASKNALEAATPTTEDRLETYVDHPLNAAVANNMPTMTDWKSEVDSILREFAKLDGFNIKLRTSDVFSVESPYKESRSWLAPVRVYARDDDWQVEGSDDKGTHNENGLRQVYLQWLKDNNKFNEDGSLADTSVLEPSCIEANDFNLSAGRYKSFAPETTDYGQPVDLIVQLREREQNILKGLEQLLAMVESKT